MRKCCACVCVTTPLVALAREATARREIADEYGNRAECEALMAEIERASALMQSRTNIAHGSQGAQRAAAQDCALPSRRMTRRRLPSPMALPSGDALMRASRRPGQGRPHAQCPRRGYLGPLQGAAALTPARRSRAPGAGAGVGTVRTPVTMSAMISAACASTTSGALRLIELLDVSDRRLTLGGTALILAREALMVLVRHAPPDAHSG